MTIATGVNKEVAIKEEAAWSVAPGITSPPAQLMRRVSFDLDMERRAFESQEQRPDLQVADMRLGTKMPRGTLRGEVSCATYASLWEAILRTRFAAGPTTGAQTNIQAQASPAGFVRASGSFLSDGFKVGQLVRVSGFTTTGAANNDKNFRIIAVTATDMLVAGTVVAQAAGDNVTIAVPGKIASIPHVKSEQLDLSYSIENWWSDLGVSELFTGVKWSSGRLRVPAEGMCEFEFVAMARDKVRSSDRYFTNPTDVEDTAILSSMTGKIRVNGVDRDTITNFELAVEGNYQAPAVAFSNLVPDIIEGRARVSGTMTALYDDDDLAALFEEETETSIQILLTDGSEEDADAIVIDLPRVKLGGARKNDTEQAIAQTVPFTALIKTQGSGDGTAYERTTITMTDTAL